MEQEGLEGEVVEMKLLATASPSSSAIHQTGKMLAFALFHS